MMDLSDSFELWADTHVFSRPDHHHMGHDDAVGGKLADWDRRMREETPNGDLLSDNSLFDLLRRDDKARLLHVTHGLDAIVERGVLYPSGGCLVGAVYTTPLAEDGDGLRMHNLGEYVLTRESALAQKNGHTKGTPTPLVIEVELPPTAYRGVMGIDYLRLGQIHLSIYEGLEYLLARDERHKLRDTVSGRVRNAMPFLQSCIARCLDGRDSAPEVFLGSVCEAVDLLPILGYLYFESLSEYLMLHSATARTKTASTFGEFDNWPYKEFLFGAFPGMAGRFDLARFNPSVAELSARLTSIDGTIDTEHIVRWLADRLAALVCARLLLPAAHSVDWRRLRWEIDFLKPYAAPLLGHLIHRELRAFGRYPDFYFYFDQVKALQAWNYWNHMGVVLPYNAVIPKGEVGINPAYPQLKTTVYKAELGGDGKIHQTERVEVSIAPRLIDLRFTLMRARHDGGQLADAR